MPGWLLTTIILALSFLTGLVLFYHKVIGNDTRSDEQIVLTIILGIVGFVGWVATGFFFWPSLFPPLGQVVLIFGAVSLGWVILKRVGVVAGWY